VVHLLSSDLQNIQKFLDQVWLGYKQGAFDLVAASVTLCPMHGRSLYIGISHRRRFEKHINVLYAVQCKVQGHEPDTMKRPDDNLNFAFAMSQRLCFCQRSCSFRRTIAWLTRGPFLPAKPEFLVSKTRLAIVQRSQFARNFLRTRSFSSKFNQTLCICHETRHDPN
jgi:hypothetical protein